MNEEQHIRNLEAFLFYKGEPVRIKEIARRLALSEEKVQEHLHTLAGALAERGIRLVREGDYAGLATAREAYELIEAIRKEELTGPLGKAGLETLAIVVYHGPLPKSDIEYIRGVNCSSILRTLMIRGLIEKIENPSDKRSFLYRGTPELPASLGLASTKDAPDYERIKADIQKVLEDNREEAHA